MDRELNMACLYYDLYDACEWAYAGFDNYANYFDDDNEVANMYLVNAYIGLEIFLQYDIVLDTTADFGVVRKFVKAGRGREKAYGAGWYFYCQMEYFKRITTDYKENGLWQQAEAMYHKDRDQFYNRVESYKHADHELLSTVQRRLKKG